MFTFCECFAGVLYENVLCTHSDVVIPPSRFFFARSHNSICLLCFSASVLVRQYERFWLHLHSDVVSSFMLFCARSHISGTTRQRRISPIHEFSCLTHSPSITSYSYTTLVHEFAVLHDMGPSGSGRGGDSKDKGPARKKQKVRASVVL